MKRLIRSSQFKSDVKRMIKRGADMADLEAILMLLVEDKDLPARCRPHKLVGQYQGLWDCHLKPDWILIYDVREDSIGLARTGTHSDLF